MCQRVSRHDAAAVECDAAHFIIALGEWLTLRRRHERPDVALGRSGENKADCRKSRGNQQNRVNPAHAGWVRRHFFLLREKTRPSPNWRYDHVFRSSETLC
ncbi:hypothetical protein J2X13_002323 [Aminobacter aminovorans]|nr:hypothetical protein [Aminobacter aminovorans]